MEPLFLHHQPPNDGFSSLSAVGFAINVINRYFDVYFPRAMQAASAFWINQSCATLFSLQRPLLISCELSDISIQRTLGWWIYISIAIQWKVIFREVFIVRTRRHLPPFAALSIAVYSGGTPSHLMPSQRPMTHRYLNQPWPLPSASRLHLARRRPPSCLSATFLA